MQYHLSSSSCYGTLKKVAGNKYLINSDFDKDNLELCISQNATNEVQSMKRIIFDFGTDTIIIPMIKHHQKTFEEAHLTKGKVFGSDYKIFGDTMFSDKEYEDELKVIKHYYPAVTCAINGKLFPLYNDTLYYNGTIDSISLSSVYFSYSSRKYIISDSSSEVKITVPLKTYFDYFCYNSIVNETLEFDKKYKKVKYSGEIFGGRVGEFSRAKLRENNNKK